MRRSHRDAMIGFTLLGGVAMFSGLMFWLEGIRVSRNDWEIIADFDNATGLTEGTPVTFRGIKVGSVEGISFTKSNVQTKIRIDKNDLLLFKPVHAKVLASSVLGRDIEVSLISKGNFINEISPSPTKSDCPKELIVCEGDRIRGTEMKSISSLTEELNQLLSKAGDEDLIKKMVNSITQFDETQEELEELIELSKEEMKRAKPIITELRKSVTHVNNILSAIDNPETLDDIQSTASSMRSTTQRIDQLAADLSDLITNEEFTSAIQSAAVGIGKLFNDLYP